MVSLVKKRVIEIIDHSNLEGMKLKQEIRSEIQSELLSNDCSSEEMLDVLSDDLVQEYADIDLFACCIDKLIENKSYDKRIDSVILIVCNLVTTCGVDIVSSFVANLVIDTNGFKRDLGRRLWDGLNFVDSNINLLDWPEEFQARFALSILQDYNNPKQRLPKIMTLFNSPSKLVREMVLSALTNATVNYTMNYFGTVKKYYEDAEIQESKETKIFEDYIINLSRRFEDANKCKELYSEYAMPEVIEYSKKAVEDNLKEKMAEAEKKRDAFIKKFGTKVVLGKGGGWRNQNGSVQPLGHFKVSTELPSMVNSLSYLEQEKYFDYLYLDWSSINEK